MASNTEYYKELKADVAERYAEVKALALEEVNINDMDLDGESLRTSRLHSKWLSMMGEEAVKMRQLTNLMKKILLERTRYWMGTQTNSYYAEYGICHVKVLKTDIGLYIDADEYMCLIREVLEVQAQLVEFLEKTVKEISSRTYHIRAAIDWRKFEAGG